MLIVDTNVISDVMRPSPSLQVMEWWSQQQSGELFIATISVAVVLYGIEILPRGKRCQALRCSRVGLHAGSSGTDWTFDYETACSFPVTAAGRRAQGRPILEGNAQIASMALSTG